VNLKSRRHRRFRENIKRAGIWIFLGCFLLSILGVVLVTATR